MLKITTQKEGKVHQYPVNTQQKLFSIKHDLVFMASLFTKIIWFYSYSNLKVTPLLNICEIGIIFSVDQLIYDQLNFIIG